MGKNGQTRDDAGRFERTAQEEQFEVAGQRAEQSAVEIAEGLQIPELTAEVRQALKDSGLAAAAELGISDEHASYIINSILEHFDSDLTKTEDKTQASAV